MGGGTSFPRLRQVVLDTTDARTLAEFYRKLLGFAYRPGDEPPGPGQDDERGRDWLVLRDLRILAVWGLRGRRLPRCSAA